MTQSGAGPDNQSDALPGNYVRAALLVIGSSALVMAICIRNGFYNPVALGWLAGSLAAIAIAALARLSPLRTITGPRLLLAALGFCLMMQFAWAAAEAPAAHDNFVIQGEFHGQQLVAYHDLEIYWAMIAFAAVLAGSLLSP